MEYEECYLRLKEERKARMIAEERIMEVAIIFFLEYQHAIGYNIFLQSV